LIIDVPECSDVECLEERLHFGVGDLVIRGIGVEKDDETEAFRQHREESCAFAPAIVGGERVVAENPEGRVVGWIIEHFGDGDIELDEDLAEVDGMELRIAAESNSVTQSSEDECDHPE
jgi:hypothetical protein